MATAAAAATKSTAHTSSTASGAPRREADATSRVAVSRMPAVAAASAVPLEGDYDFVQNLNDAEQLLADGRNENARRLFREIHIQSLTPDFGLDSLIPTHCLLGIAHSYPEGKDRTDNAADAYTALNVVYANTREWDRLNNQQKSSAYLTLRSCLKQLKPLIPEDKVEAHQDVDAKIAECSKFILPLDAFHDIVKEADEYLQNNEIENARNSYLAALTFIGEKTEIEFLVGRAFCLLKLTETYTNDTDIKAQLRTSAQIALFSLYDHRASLYTTGKYDRVDAFKMLIGYLRALRSMTLERVDRQAIQERIDACKPQIPAEASQIRLRRAPPAPAAPSGPTGRGSAPPPESPPRKVAPGSPDGSCNLCRLIIACVFIAAIAVAGVTLYRRYVVKIN